MKYFSHRINFSVFIFFILSSLFVCKIWTPEALSKEMRTWNSLVDPESFLIEEEDFSARLNNNYFKTNKIYDKVDVNLFVIPRIPDRYAYTHTKYADELIAEIEKNEDIKKENRKSSHLTIIFIIKQNAIIMRPSEKLKKMLTKEDINSIVSDTVDILKNKNYTKAIIFVFEKLDALWRKYKKSPTNTKQTAQKDMASKMENVYQIQAIVFLVFVLFVLIIYFVQKWTKKRVISRLHTE